MKTFKSNHKVTFNARTLAVTGITAALYMAATLMIAPLGFNAVQFRLSEVMVLLCYIDPIYAPGLILGCALANCFSPLGIIDVVIGTAATAFAVFMILRTKNLFAATLWPTVSGLIIAIGLTVVYHTPYLLNALSVMAGEFVVVTCIGYPVFKAILKNHRLVGLLRQSENKNYAGL